MPNTKKSPTGPTEPRISPEMCKQLRAQKGIRRLFGKVKWEGNLAQMREGRFLEWPDGVDIRQIKRISPAPER